MARRPTLRTMLRLERLESREVLNAGGPTAEMQELLEITNFARQHPAEAADWAFSDLKTDNLKTTLSNFSVDIGRAKSDIAGKAVAQPLGWSDQLASAANTLSRYQAESGQQTHTGSGGTLSDGTPVGVSIQDRFANAHYDNATSFGENAFAYSRSVANSMKAFLIDWGNDVNVKPHLSTVTNPAFREAGFGIVATNNNGLGPKVITQDFGSRAGAKPMLLGVAFNDSVVADRMYEAGEGVGDLSIDVTDANGRTQTVRTWDAGGYQLALDPGHYTVTARQGDRVFRTQGVDVGDQNVKVDFNLSEPWALTPVAPPAEVPATPPPVVEVVAPPAAEPVAAPVVEVVVPVIPTPPAEETAPPASAPVVEATPPPAAETPQTTETTTVAASDDTVDTTSLEAVNQFVSQEDGGNQDVVLPSTTAANLAVTGNDPSATLSALSADDWQAWAP